MSATGARDFECMGNVFIGRSKVFSIKTKKAQRIITLSFLVGEIYIPNIIFTFHLAERKLT